MTAINPNLLPEALDGHLRNADVTWRQLPTVSYLCSLADWTSRDLWVVNVSRKWPSHEMSARYTPSRLLHFSNEGDEKPFCHLDKRIHSEKSDFFKSLLLTSGLTLNDFFFAKHFATLHFTQNSILLPKKYWLRCAIQFTIFPFTKIDCYNNFSLWQQKIESII